MHNERCTSGSERGARRPTRCEPSTASGTHSTTIPELVKQLAKLNELLERIVAHLEQKKD